MLNGKDDKDDLNVNPSTWHVSYPLLRHTDSHINSLEGNNLREAGRGAPATNMCPVTVYITAGS
jgi:hypothetical protein